mgnify:CR=1 FL=1
MRRWLRWSVVLCLVVWLVPGCATFLGNSGARHPVPTALDWPEYDRAQAGGVTEWSLRTETAGRAILGEVWTRGAAEQRDAFWQRILRDRCAAREALQIANGDQPAPDAVCLPGREVH